MGEKHCQSKSMITREKYLRFSRTIPVVALLDIYCGYYAMAKHILETYSYIFNLL